MKKTKAIVISDSDESDVSVLCEVAHSSKTAPRVARQRKQINYKTIISSDESEDEPSDESDESVLEDDLLD